MTHQGNTDATSKHGRLGGFLRKSKEKLTHKQPLQLFGGSQKDQYTWD